MTIRRGEPISETTDQHDHRWANAHPDFDGHLSKRVEDMTYAERLEWIEQGMRLLHLAKQARKVPREDRCE